jgi:hypothetical protein
MQTPRILSLSAYEPICQPMLRPMAGTKYGSILAYLLMRLIPRIPQDIGLVGNQYYLLVMVFYASINLAPVHNCLLTISPSGAFLPVRCHCLHLALLKTMQRSFGTPVSLLVKKFSAARVLPIMMVGFVSSLCRVHSA